MAQSSFMNVLNYGVLQGHWFSSGSPSRTIGNFGQQGNPFCGYNRNVKCQLCYEYGHTVQQCSRLVLILSKPMPISYLIMPLQLLLLLGFLIQVEIIM